MACHATSILEKAAVVLNLAEALTGVTRTVATSARQRTPPAPPLEMLGRETPPGGGCLEWLLENDTGASAIVFGREDSGLTNEELSFAQRTLKIPSDPACSSLNLSHAVAVVCYELSREALAPRSHQRTTRVQDHVGTPAALGPDVSKRDDERPNAEAVKTPPKPSDQILENLEMLRSRETFEAATSSSAGSESQIADDDRNPLERPGGSLEASTGHSGASVAAENPQEAPGGSGSQSEGPVEEGSRRGEAGWRRMRRLDRAQSLLDVADGAEVEDTLKQADALLLKMGFFKGDSRGAKLPKLRQLLLRASPTNTEVALLRAILRRMDWYVTKALGNDQREP